MEVLLGALSLARERALTCVFLDEADAPGAAATLDFVYPHMRSPLCLHATLAAAKVLFERHGTDAPLAVTTAMHGQRLDLTQLGEDVYIVLARQAAAPLPLKPTYACDRPETNDR